METLSSLRRQIHNAEDLQSIVKSMKAMAAASIWKYQQAVASLEDYERTVELGLQIVLGACAEKIEIAQPPLQEPIGAVIFGSEQGMVGNFNDEIVRYAVRRLDALDVPVKGRSLIAVGRRVHGKLENARQPVALTMRMPTSIVGIRPAVQHLMVQLDTWREQENVEGILLFFNAPTAGTQYEPQGEQLIPVNLNWLQHLQEEPWQSNSLPTFDMSWDALFADLIREYIYVMVFGAFAASLSAENASRLSAMEAAESNIEDRLGELEQRYHQVRQRSITSELLDIVAGAEAATDTAG